MKVSLRWLRDYAALDAPLDTLVHALTETGTEVGAVERGGAGMIVARVAAVRQLPGSGHGLQLVDIDVGDGRVPVEVVCGAPNVRVGRLVAYAPPGSRPPGMDDAVGVRRFRGDHRSPGMLCSAAELGTAEDADGILILDDGRPGQALGEVVEMDSVIDVDITTNRPDCMCHVGIARELCAALGEALTEPVTDIPNELVSAASAKRTLSVRVDDPAGCPRFTTRIIEGIAIGPSPPWMQQRLRSVGLRPINNVVDVTNFVTHELGQPLHAFDLDRFIALGGSDSAAVVVRRARKGEVITDLTGQERALDPADLVVCSGEAPASIAGVIGGAATAVDASTGAVLLEAACWEGTGIRATSTRLGLRTDASTLFEKGLSDQLAPLGLDRAAALIARLGGGHVLSGADDQWPRRLPELGPISVTAAHIGDLLGMPVDATEVATALAHLGFAVEQDGSVLVVLPPYFRRDVVIAADVVEEVGRMLGYSRIPSTLPGRRMAATGTAPVPMLEDTVRDVCLGAGFDEAITLSFVSAALAASIPGIGGARRPMVLRNPLSEEWSLMRTSQLPALCAALATNLNRGNDGVALFELGRVFWDGERDGLPPGSTADGADRALPPLPLEPLVLSLVAHDGIASSDSAAAALRRIQGTFDWLAHDLTGGVLVAEPVDAPGLMPGRTASLTFADRPVGLLGELAAATLDSLELRGRVVVGELRLDTLAPDPPRRLRFVPVPSHPPIVQDLSMTVDADRPAGTALTVIRAAGEPLLEHVELYDEFRGGRIPAGRKGWTFRLRFRAANRTLTGDEAQAAQDAIVAALVERCGAELRR